MDNAIKLLNTLVRAGWSANVMHEHDTGGHPFLTVEAANYEGHMRVVWHTRGNQGAYRLHSCVVNGTESTLKDAHGATA